MCFLFACLFGFFIFFLFSRGERKCSPPLQQIEFKEAEVPPKIISRLEIHWEGKVLQKTAWGSHGLLDEYKDMYAYSETLWGLERTPLGKKQLLGNLRWIIPKLKQGQENFKLWLGREGRLPLTPKAFTGYPRRITIQQQSYK